MVTGCLARTRTTQDRLLPVHSPTAYQHRATPLTVGRRTAPQFGVLTSESGRFLHYRRSTKQGTCPLYSDAPACVRPTARIVFRLYGVRSTKWFQRGLRTAYSLVPRESELPNCTKPQGERSRNGWLPAHTRITARTTRPETNARTSTAGGRVPPAPSLQPGRGSNHKRSTSTASCRCAQ